MTQESDRQSSAPAPEFTEFDSFWAFYLGEHKRPGCRALHYAGAALGLFLMFRFVVFASVTCAACAIPAAYACAWIGHFFLEGNRPATWRYPLWSLRSEFRMCRMALTGRLRGEFERFGIPFNLAEACSSQTT